MGECLTLISVQRIEVWSASGGGRCHPHRFERLADRESNGQRNRLIGRKASGWWEGYCPYAGPIDRYVAWTIDRAPVGVAEYERLHSRLIHLKFSEGVGLFICYRPFPG